MTHQNSLRKRCANTAFAAATATALAFGLAAPAAAAPADDDVQPKPQASESPSPQASEEPTDEPGSASEDTDPSGGGEGAGTDQPSAQPTDAPSEEPTDEPSETPAADAPADEYYPELAKKLFKTGDEQYAVPEPTPGGTSAGKVPSGLEAYYSQKVDWSAENCEALGLRDFSEELGRPAECGYMIAPIDADNPDKGNVAIAVQRVKAGKVTYKKNADGKEVPSGFKPNPNPKGSVLFNPGGPGGSGMMFAAYQAMGEPDLAEDFDMVGFDPRGVGSSMPFSECATDAEQDASREKNPWKDGRDAAEEVFNTDTKKYADACFENTGKLFGLDADGRKDLIKHLGTWDAVGDMDLLRSVVGDEKLNYVGWSYGTSLGYRYAQKFGDSAGRLVLDGVVDPGDSETIKAMKEINARSDRFADLSDPKGGAAKADKSGRAVKTEKLSRDVDTDGLTPDQIDTVKQGAGFQDTFEQFARDCVAKGKENKTYGELWPEGFKGSGLENETFTCALGEDDDPNALSDANAKLLQTLETAGDGKGLPTGQPNDDRNVTFSTGRMGEIQALYSTSLWPRLNLALNELKAGKSAGQLMILADMYDGRDENGHFDPSGAAFNNVRCTDSNDADQPKDDAKLAQLRKFAEAYDAAAPFQRASVSAGGYDVCDFWKFKGTLPKASHLSKVPNILVVSTSHDPATPYAAGVKMAQLIDGSLLSVSGSSHTSYSGEGNCVDETVNGFLSDGTVPRDGDFGEKLDKPDTAKDHEGNTVTLPNKCKMETFRTDGFSLSADEAHIGEEIGFKVSHLDSEAKYAVKIGGTTIDFTTDNGGNYAGTFTVPKGLNEGSTAEVDVVDADGNVVKTAGLKIMSSDDAKKDDPNAGGSIDAGTSDDDKSGSDKGSAGTGSSDANGASEDSADSAQDSDGKPLPRTGAEIAAALAAAALLLAGGTAAAAGSRRRARR